MFVVIPFLVRGVVKLVRRYRGRGSVAEVQEVSATRP